MEKVSVKIELERDDISMLMRMMGSKLSDEQWDKMKGQEHTLSDEEMGDQAIEMKVAFGALAIALILGSEVLNSEEP